MGRGPSGRLVGERQLGRGPLTWRWALGARGPLGRWLAGSGNLLVPAWDWAWWRRRLARLAGRLAVARRGGCGGGEWAQEADPVAGAALALAAVRAPSSGSAGHGERRREAARDA